MKRGCRSDPIGIDFGPYLRAAGVEPGRGGAPTFTLVDAVGARSGIGVLDAVRRRLGACGRWCVACPPRSEVLVESISIPRMSVANVHDAAAGELAARFGDRAADLELRVVGVGIAHDDPARQDVLVVAVPRATLSAMTQALDATGWRPLAIVSHVEALVHAVAVVGGGARSTGPQLIIEVDRSGTTILAASGRHPAVCRRLGVSGEAMDQAVAARLGIDLYAAGELRRRRMDADRDDLPPAVERAAREAIRPLLRDLATAMRLTVRNFGATFRGPTPGRVVLAGTEAAEPDLASHLAERTELPVLGPDQWWMAKNGASAASGPRRIGGAAVAVGLITAMTDSVTPRARAA